MIEKPETGAQPTFHDVQPGDATAAVITLAADANEIHVLDWVVWSYDAAQTAGQLTVTIAGTTVFDIDILASGPGSVTFPGGLYGSNKNEAMVITLKAGDTGEAGKLNARTR